jgi:hypothetical protein
MCAFRARVRRVALGLSIACAIAVAGHPARACAPCGCGDPTLTAVGVEKPYKNRLRLVLEERVGDRSSGSGLTLNRLLTTRTQLGVLYSPHARVMLEAFLPFLAIRLTDAKRHQYWIRGLGDLELQARFVVYRDRAFASRHMFWLFTGLKTPTAPRINDDTGHPYPDDDQPGSGSWDPLGGATYAWFGKSLTVYSSLLARVPTPGSRALRFGASLLSSSGVQLQPYPWLALQMGVNLRYAWADVLPNGADMSDSGGFTFGIAPAVMVNPWRDLLFRLTAEVPLVQALNGHQSLGPQLVFSIAYDIF